MHYFSDVVFLLLVGAVLVASKSAHTRINAENPSALKTVSSGNEKFSFDLLKVIGFNGRENLVASPLSLLVVLGFLSQGAQGITKEQILKATHLPADDDVTRAGFKSLLTPMHSTSNYTLDLADAAFVEQTFVLKSSFQNVARESFNADTKPVDFLTNQSSAVDAINQWVKDHTGGKIQNLVSPSDVSSETKFVLVNTLYFNGTWENRFNASLTKKLPFHVDGQTTVQMDMMTTMASFNYAVNKELDAKVLALNYKGSDFRMLLVLPNKVDGLEALESSINSLDQIKANLILEKVLVTMPKFKVEQELIYNSILQQLGITAMFTSEADLRGISEAGQLTVSQVKQKAVIEVSEEGAIAAAATDVDGPTSVLSHDFTADHGFLYILEHAPTNSVVMYGRYVKP